jgi:Ca-activated chloride channel family protein
VKRAGLLPLLLLRALNGEPAQVPSFGSAVEVVRLDVSVTREGAPVRGLAAADFEILDEGVHQAAGLVDQDEATIHAVLALDTSSSVAGEKLSQLKAAAHRFVDALRPDDTLSLLTFSECIDLAVVQSRSREEAHAAIELASTKRTTSLHDACLASLALADPALGRPLVLVFSDGQDVGSWTSDERVLDLARASEAVVHAVVPTAEDLPGILQELTGETGGRMWQAAEGVKLGDVFLSALEEFRSRYRLQYEPRGVRAGGWHRLQVRVKNGDARVYARRGYLHRGGS